MTKRDILLLELASILDHPSVYMGGPSWTNKEKAGRILKYLEKEDLLRITEQEAASTQRLYCESCGSECGREKVPMYRCDCTKLQRIAPVPEQSTLQAAEQALKRMESRNHDTVEEWASQLAADFAKLKD